MRFTWSAMFVLSALVLLTAIPANGQNKRDEKVRGDREMMQNDDSWYYDDLDSGFAAALKSKQPLMVVLRCIP